MEDFVLYSLFANGITGSYLAKTCQLPRAIQWRLSGSRNRNILFHQSGGQAINGDIIDHLTVSLLRPLDL